MSELCELREQTGTEPATLKHELAHQRRLQRLPRAGPGPAGPAGEAALRVMERWSFAVCDSFRLAQAATWGRVKACDGSAEEFMTGVTRRVA